ncbi:MAG: transposase [Planctomycetota bacterium]|jgi:hypothetical protein
MSKRITTKRNIERFTDQCFDRESEKAARIIKGVLDAGSPRISDIADAMDGNSDANYKAIQRFIEDDKPKEALNRLYNEESEYILGDPTDIERPQAGKTDYVGKLKSKKLGFTIMFLATPYRGRAIPFSFITYSSKTIGAEMSSRNMKHIKSVAELKELLGDKILVMDREFSYEFLFAEIAESDMQYAIRLKTGNNPGILDEEGNKISLTVGIGEEVHYEGVYYKGKVKVNLAGKWERGFNGPIWVIGSLKPSELLRVYGLRGKIDESFRDMKSLLNLDKIMNKKQVNMEKMVALVALAYIIGFLIGEQIRDQAYAGSRKWKQYSGLFILLKRKIRLAREVLLQALEDAYILFRRIVLGNVRTFV